jgi:hypothetical protein
MKKNKNNIRIENKPRGLRGFQGYAGGLGSGGSQGNLGFQGFQGVSGTQGTQGIHLGNQGGNGTQGNRGNQGMSSAGNYFDISLDTDTINMIPKAGINDIFLSGQCNAVLICGLCNYMNGGASKGINLAGFNNTSSGKQCVIVSGSGSNCSGTKGVCVNTIATTNNSSVGGCIINGNTVSNTFATSRTNVFGGKNITMVGYHSDCFGGKFISCQNANVVLGGLCNGMGGHSYLNNIGGFQNRNQGNGQFGVMIGGNCNISNGANAVCIGGFQSDVADNNEVAVHKLRAQESITIDSNTILNGRCNISTLFSKSNSTPAHSLIFTPTSSTNFQTTPISTFSGTDLVVSKFSSNLDCDRWEYQAYRYMGCIHLVGRLYKLASSAKLAKSLANIPSNTTESCRITLPLKTANFSTYSQLLGFGMISALNPTSGTINQAVKITPTQSATTADIYIRCDNYVIDEEMEISFDIIYQG